MVQEIDEDCTALDVCLSHETHWLRSACSRNRARIIAHVCDRMGIAYPAMRDYNAAAPAPRLAICTTETLHHDMRRHGPSFVRILNYCSETSRAFNGSVCAMAPWDGLWIMHGASSGGDDAHCEFGTAYGAHFLPTAAPMVAPGARSAKGTSSLSFLSADPSHCKAMQVWGVEAKQVAVQMRPLSMEPVLLSLGTDVCTDGLDYDIAEAYKKILAKHRNPDNLLILPSNAYSSLSSSSSHHHHTYLLFDEIVLQYMASRGWPRSHGYSTLIPLACALGSAAARCSPTVREGLNCSQTHA